MSESLIPRPHLEDSIQLNSDEIITITRENCTLVIHALEQYKDFDHIHVHKVGEYGLKLFGIYQYEDYMIGRGYDVLIRQYPDETTAAVWMDWQNKRLNKELDGAGGELDG